MQKHILDTMNPKALGLRLQESRKARGLTQQQVADDLGIARTTVTALEKGERRIRPDELIRMARLYGRTVSDLVGDRPAAGDFAVQFRAAILKTGDRRTESEAAVYEFQRLCEDYLYLEKVTESPLPRHYPSQYPTARLPQSEAAEDTAWRERTRLGLGEGPIHKLRELLENDVGLRIFYMRMPSHVSGMFAYTEELGGCIAVNSQHPEERRRWSLAHEYAHFLTGRFRPEITVTYAYQRLPASERFGDAFAAAFLMPASGLRRAYSEIVQSRGFTPADLCRLAHYEFVSVEALARRLEDLRLLRSGTWDRLRDRGFKVREAQDILELKPHPAADELLPLRYRYLAAEAYQSELLTEGELARLLRVDRGEARRVVQRLTSQAMLLEDGSLASLIMDLAATLGEGHR